ncbi:MAG: hypothetical protein LUH05_08770, partial [Candidatus Gastranaerophilales bacterium]|nr:hypothetical protein [Candidatus Gastranaerophilales bacterium]
MISKEKAISTLILIFITAALFFILVNFFSCACCFADDNWSAILPEFCQADPLSCGYFKNFFYESYPSGLFISTFLNRLFGVFLPLWLNLHPSDFKMYYFCYIAPLFIFSFIFILNSLLIKKINYFYPVCFLFTTSLLFMIFQHPVGALYLYDGLFRMIMPCFLFAGLFCLLLNNTDNYTLKNYIPVFIMTFLCCISNELISVTTIFGFLLYAVLSINLNQKKKVHTYLLFCIFLSFLGLLILYKTGTFYRKSENVIFN